MLVTGDGRLFDRPVEGAGADPGVSERRKSKCSAQESVQNSVEERKSIDCIESASSEDGQGPLEHEAAGGTRAERGRRGVVRGKGRNEWRRGISRKISG